MRASFSEIIKRKIEQNSIFKKIILRIFTTCLSLGIFFSAFGYHLFQIMYMQSGSSKFLSFFCFITVSFMLGGLCSFLVYKNILSNIKKIIHELSNEKPRWN